MIGSQPSDEANTNKLQPSPLSKGRLSPARVANHRLNHKLSSSSMSMSAPPLSPPFSDEQPNSPDAFSPPVLSGGQSKPTPLGPSSAQNKQPPLSPAQVPFPSAPTSSFKPENGLNEFPFPHGSTDEAERSATPSRRPARVSSGGEVLAQLARSISTRAVTPASPAEAPKLDIEWLQTKDRDELEALLVAADAVIRDSQSQLQTVAEVGKALLDENTQLRSKHDSLLARSTQPRHRSTLSQSSIISNSPEQSARRQHLFSPDQPRLAFDRVNTAPAGLFSHSGAPRGADDHNPGSEPTSPTSPTNSLRYNGIGLGPAAMVRPRVSSTSSVSSLFAPSPRTHIALSPAEVHALSQANYALSAQLTELEAEAEQKAQEGKKRLRKLEKEINGLRSELQRTSERNQALEETVSQVATQAVATEAALDEVVAAIEEPVEATPRMSRRPSRNETLSTLGMVTDFAPPFSPTRPNPLDTPTGRGRGLGLARSQRRFPSGSDESDAVVTQLMAKIDELQRENEVIEEGRTEMEGKLGKAHEEVQLFKRRCEELEDEIVLGLQQPVIGWHSMSSTPGGSPVQLKGNRREIEKRHRRLSEFGSIQPSRQSSGQMTYSTSNKSLADSTQSDSPEVSPRFTSFTKRDRPPFRTGRTLESELGDRSYEENDYDLDHDTPQEHDQFTYHPDPDQSFNSSTATDFTADPAYRPASPSQTRVVSVYTGVRASHSFIPPGALRQSGPPEEEQYNTIDRASNRQELVWMDLVDPYIPPKEPTPRTLQAAFFESLDWARESRGDSDDDQDDVLQDGKFPTKEELEEAEALKERMARLSYASLRPRKRSLKKKARRIGSGAAGEAGEGADGLTRREAAQRRLGLEASDAEYADLSDYEEGEEDNRSCVSVASEFDLLDGERPAQADYWPIALRARYAPRMVISRSMDAVFRQLVILLVYVRFYALLGLAVGFALWQGPDKTLGAPRRRIR